MPGSGIHLGMQQGDYISVTESDNKKRYVSSIDSILDGGKYYEEK